MTAASHTDPFTTSLSWANGALMFGLELGALGVLAWAASRLSDSTPVSVVLGLGTAVAVAVVWGLFASPQPTLDVPAMAVLVKAAVFGGAALALVLAGRTALGITVGVLAVVATVGARLLPIG